MFWRKSGSDLVFTSQIPLLERKPVCLVDWLDAKFHHGQCGKRLLYFGERRLYFGERRLFSETFPLWSQGGIDSANSANKPAR